MYIRMNPRYRLEVWCEIHIYNTSSTLAPCGDFWFQSMVPHQSCALGIQTSHNTPYICLGHMQSVVFFGHTTCMIIDELAHLWGRVDVHHFDKQQERGCTTKVDSTWSVLRYILVRCPLPPTQSVCGGDYFALCRTSVGSGMSS
jgi:hypothetical protein